MGAINTSRSNLKSQSISDDPTIPPIILWAVDVEVQEVKVQETDPPTVTNVTVTMRVGHQSRVFQCGFVNKVTEK